MPQEAKINATIDFRPLRGVLIKPPVLRVVGNLKE